MGMGIQVESLDSLMRGVLCVSQISYLLEYLMLSPNTTPRPNFPQ